MSHYSKHGKQEPGEEPEPRRIELDEDQTFIDPYQVLDIPRDASLEDIKKAYFAKVREYPPEREQAIFKRVRAAYDALRTPEAKAATDLFLIHPPRAYEPYKRPPSFDLEFHESDWWRLAEAHSDLGRVDFRNDFRKVKL